MISVWSKINKCMPNTLILNLGSIALLYNNKVQFIILLVIKLLLIRNRKSSVTVRMDTSKSYILYLLLLFPFIYLINIIFIKYCQLRLTLFLKFWCMNCWTKIWEITKNKCCYFRRKNLNVPNMCDYIWFFISVCREWM